MNTIYFIQAPLSYICGSSSMHNVCFSFVWENAVKSATISTSSNQLGYCLKSCLIGTATYMADNVSTRALVNSWNILNLEFPLKLVARLQKLLGKLQVGHAFNTFISSGNTGSGNASAAPFFVLVLYDKSGSSRWQPALQ